MQASLVLLAIEIRPSELEHRPVVEPQEEADRKLDQVRHNHKSPELCAPDILRCELQQCRDIIPLLVEIRTANDIDGYQDAASKYCNHAEYVSEHPHKP